MSVWIYFHEILVICKSELSQEQWKRYHSYIFLYVHYIHVPTHKSLISVTLLDPLGSDHVFTNRYATEELHGPRDLSVARGAKEQLMDSLLSTPICRTLKKRLPQLPPCKQAHPW